MDFACVPGHARGDIPPRHGCPTASDQPPGTIPGASGTTLRPTVKAFANDDARPTSPRPGPTPVSHGNPPPGIPLPTVPASTALRPTITAFAHDDARPRSPRPGPTPVSHGNPPPGIPLPTVPASGQPAASSRARGFVRRGARRSGGGPAGFRGAVPPRSPRPARTLLRGVSFRSCGAAGWPAAAGRGRPAAGRGARRKSVPPPPLRAPPRSGTGCAGPKTTPDPARRPPGRAQGENGPPGGTKRDQIAALKSRPRNQGSPPCVSLLPWAEDRPKATRGGTHR